MTVEWDVDLVESHALVGSVVLHAWEGPEDWHWSVREGLKTLTQGEAPSHATARWAAEEALRALGER
jgi:hypothetical protein